jgi:integrase
VGSNPTLSAIYQYSNKLVLFTPLLQIFPASVGPCAALQREICGHSNRLLPAKDRGNRLGRQPAAAKNGPYFIRVRDRAGKYQWVKHDTEQAAEKAAKAAPVARQAHELGLTVDDLTNEANTNRISIKTAVENYLQDRRFGRPRYIAAYENVFDQLLANLPRGVRFIDQLATPRALNAYVEFLGGQDYTNKTISIRMGFIFSLLKANGIEKSSKFIKLPNVQRTRTKAYEVQYATWKELDLKGLRFTVSSEGKSDVAFLPKNHEERQVPLTTELGSLLTNHKKHSLSDRWVFTNEDGKPEGHFLRKFKMIAKRSGLNCGQCKTTIREGRYDNRHEVERTCETRPVCEEPLPTPTSQDCGNELAALWFRFNEN